MKQPIRRALGRIRGSLMRQVNRIRGWSARRAIGPNVAALVVESNGLLYAIDAEDCGVGRELRAHGVYGAEEVERIAPLLGPQGRLLVVGAHVGTLVAPLSKRCAQVVAIEANPLTYKLLGMTLALNGVTNCRAIQIAASDEPGSIEFLLSRVNSGGSKRVPKVKKGMYYYDQPQTVSVPSAPLDDVLAGELFDVVVMDIEGSEYFALRGMQRILAGCRALVVEFLPHHLRNVSGVSVGQFLDTLPPFARLTIPTQGRTVPYAEAERVLSEMHDEGIGDPGLVFER